MDDAAPQPHDDTGIPDAANPAAPPPMTEPAPVPAATPDPAASPPNPMAWMDRLPLWTVPATLVIVPALAALLAKFSPAFYRDVIWKYYWGPIKADAENRISLVHDGVIAHSGYNLVNTLSWAVLLGLCILGIAQMLRHYRTPMDSRLIVAATSWVVVGSMAHVLEDTGLFLTPLQYFFITPPIYLLFGAFGVGSFLLAQWLKNIEAKRDLHAALRMLWLIHVVLVVAWLGFWLKSWNQIIIYVNPLWVAGIAVVSYFAARHFILKRGTIDPTQLCLTLGIGTYLLVIAYLISFLQDPWMTPSDNAKPWSSVIAPLLALGTMVLVWKAPRKAILGFIFVGGSLAGGVVLLYVLRLLAGGILDGRLNIALGATIDDNLVGARALAVVAIGAIYVAYRWGKALKPKLQQTLADMDPAYGWGINLLIVFGQMVDAFATSYGIDLAGYDEKHVLSAGIIDEFRDYSTSIGFDFGATYPTFIAFVAVKLLVSLLVIYAIDVQSKNDANANPTLIGLVKFAIIMVGLGPGVRDFVRLSLGV